MNPEEKENGNTEGGLPLEGKKEVGVLKLVQHGNRVFVSTDYIRGVPLADWVRKNPAITRKKFLDWVRKLTEELGNFHRCKGNPCYQYLNPYSVFISEDGTLRLLDPAADGQEEYLGMMKRKGIRENFLSPDNLYYQKVSVQEDLYSLGKVIQYMLSAMTVRPKLGWIREQKFRRIIRSCTGPDPEKRAQSAEEVLQMIPRGKSTGEALGAGGRSAGPAQTAVIAACAVLAFALVFHVLSGRGSAAQKADATETAYTAEKTDAAEQTVSAEDGSEDEFREEMLRMQQEWESEKLSMQKEADLRERELLRELALVYFVELGEYDAAAKAAEEIPEKETYDEKFIRLCAFMDPGNEEPAEKDLRELLVSLQESVPDPGDSRYADCIAAGYEMLDHIAGGDATGDEPEEEKQDAGNEKKGEDDKENKGDKDNKEKEEKDLSEQEERSGI